MFDKLEFKQLNNAQCFRFDESFLSTKWIKEGDEARKLNDDTIKVKVRPNYPVYVEQLFTVQYEGLGYAAGEAYGYHLWESHINHAELFTKPEVREFILKIEKLQDFSESKLAINRVPGNRSLE